MCATLVEKGPACMPGLWSSHGMPMAASKAVQLVVTAQIAAHLCLFSSMRPVLWHPMSRGAIKYTKSIECFAPLSTGSLHGSSGAAGQGWHIVLVQVLKPSEDRFCEDLSKNEEICGRLRIVRDSACR